jgi:type IV secretory pathway ATPase VirB11/archaellum biosynthesis ATPase
MVDYEVRNGALVINARNWVVSPNIEDSEAAMAVVIDRLMEVKDVNRITISSSREIEYGFEDMKMLREIADAYYRIVNVEKLLSEEKFGPIECLNLFPKRLSELKFLILEVLRKDPIGAYVKINMDIDRLIRTLETGTPIYNDCTIIYINQILEPIRRILSECTLIKLAEPFLPTFRFGDRKIYRELFRPTIRPTFMMTRFIALPPRNSKLIEKYYVGNTLIEIYKIKGSVRPYYHVVAPEFKLKEEKYLILDQARQYLVTHKPSEAEIIEPEKAREVFMNINKDLIRDIAIRNNINLSEKDLMTLAEILTRYTAGFGVLEILLSDDRIQDVYVNSPVGLNPIYINHSDYEECETNLIPTIEDAEAWATRFRLYSGRPLDEANPVLDTEITVAGGRARVAAITRSLSPTGLAFAFRRHRERPWTFPLFIKVKYFNPLYAGLMSFIIDGGRAILVAGGRGSGKTSLLSALMLEIMRRFRIIVQEDTPEIPVNIMRQLGYNIENLKSRSVITQVQTELSAEEALRTSLRLGDSALIVGEVRSREAVALFEAMRIGALANVVAGTIHGESAYGVYDRVVHDLGVLPTSFKALDLITICNKLRSPDGLHTFRRVIELTEVRKKWKEDPLEEGGFVTLMQYSAKEDTLKPTDVLLEGESEVLNEIAKRVREWHGSWDLVWDNILLRSKIKETIVDYANKLNRPEILEAEWTVESNEMFHLISEEVKAEVGGSDSKMIYERWLEWFKEKLKSTY